MRTAAGEFRIEDAVTLDALIGQSTTELATGVHSSAATVAGVSVVTADEENVGKIRHGRAVNLPELSNARLVKVFQGQSELIAIASRVAGTLFHPKVVLTEAAQ